MTIMMMMMMMIMTDPFTTNLVVKGPVVKGSVVKGAHPMMVKMMMMVKDYVWLQLHAMPDTQTISTLMPMAMFMSIFLSQH